LEKALKAADKRAVSRWPIESAFYRVVVEKNLSNEFEKMVTSETDIFRWI